MTIYVYCDDITQVICPVEAESAEDACDLVWDKIRVKVTPAQLHSIRIPTDMVSVMEQIDRAVARDGVDEED